MLIALFVLAAPILILMVLKLLRSLQELRSARAGYITFGGDDRYQARNVHLNVHDALMIARVKLEMSADAFQEVILRVERGYLDWYKKLDASIEHRPRGGAFADPLEIGDETRNYQPGEETLLAKIIICRREQTILLVGNHIYLGGYLLSQFVQLIFCRTVSKNVFPRNRYLPIVSELMMLAFFARLLFRPAHAKSQLYPGKAQLRRFYLRRDLAEIEQKANALKMHHMYLVMAEHVQIVMQRLKKKRLRVTLPVSFNDEHSFNTVGAMFLELGEEPDLESMARKMKKMVNRARWQVAASNHIQRIFPTRRLSESARNLVDLTLTIVPQKTLPENLLGKEMKEYEFTMDNISYPVYVMAFIFENQVHSSFMINSPEFDVDAFVNTDRALPMELTL